MADYELARASKRLIITTERLIENEEIRAAPHATLIPSFCVDAVCEVRYGSYPGNMPGEYFSDEEHLQQWLSVEKDESQFRAFLEKNIYGVADFAGYLRLCGGEEKMRALRARDLLE